MHVHSAMRPLDEKSLGRVILFSLVLAIFSQMGGCAGQAPAPQGPLPTSGATVAAPAACQALRQRGGAC